MSWWFGYGCRTGPVRLAYGWGCACRTGVVRLPYGCVCRTGTREIVGGAGAAAELGYRYRGRVAGAEVRFVMRTEGGGQPHVPIEFVARRVAPAAAQAGR